MASTIVWIAAIFAACTVVAGVDEAIDRWSHRRAVRRRAERRKLRRDAWANLDEAVNYEPFRHGTPRVW